MADLHGFLSQLGFRMPKATSDKDSAGVCWITGQPFVPQMGLSYELAFVNGPSTEEGYAVTRKVRIDGTQPSEWFALEAGKTLDPAWQPSLIKAYRVIDS